MTLPEATDNTFWLPGSAWQFPTYDNAEVFVRRLVRAGLLAHDPVIEAALQGQIKDLTPRSVQYHFLQATGITQNLARQIERARYATLLLQQGNSMPTILPLSDFQVNPTAYRFEGGPCGDVAVSFFLVHTEPGQGASLHYHPYAEVFLVQEGTVTFVVGEETVTVDKGPMPQRSFWSSSEMAERWQQDVGRRRQDFAEATQRMLEAAGLKPGDHVLDIAAGTGDQSLLAARLVGPGGSILATDSSAEMLGIAARVAKLEGLTNITTRVMDAQQLDLQDNAFDAVICRLALMLIPDRKLALREIRRVLKPGRKLAALVWSAPENNPLFALPLATVANYARGASSHRPDPFALSDPTVFERELTGAGFDEVRTRTLPFESHYASLDAFLQSTASRLTADVMGQISQQEQQQLLGEVKQALSQFEGSHGLVAPAELLLGVGSKEMRPC